MDGFIEKMVKKKRTPADIMISVGIMLLAFILAMAAFLFLSQFLGVMSLMLSVGLLYLGVKLQSRPSLEYEYLVTNDNLDIDKIIAQSKRVRIFSASCKEFEAVAKVKSSHFGVHVTNGTQAIFAGVSMESPDLYYITLPYQGKKTVVYFEPDDRMLNSFKRFIPSKIQN